jgi:hypothetical protein
MGFAERPASHSTNKTRKGQANYLCLELILPAVAAEKYNKPEEFSYGCGGKDFWMRQEVKKEVCDTTYREVKAK